MEDVPRALVGVGGDAGGAADLEDLDEDLFGSDWESDWESDEEEEDGSSEDEPSSSLERSGIGTAILGGAFPSGKNSVIRSSNLRHASMHRA